MSEAKTVASVIIADAKTAYQQNQAKLEKEKQQMRNVQNALEGELYTKFTNDKAGIIESFTSQFKKYVSRHNNTPTELKIDNSNTTVCLANLCEFKTDTYRLPIDDRHDAAYGASTKVCHEIAGSLSAMGFNVQSGTAINQINATKTFTDMYTLDSISPSYNFKNICLFTLGTNTNN